MRNAEALARLKRLVEGTPEANPIHERELAGQRVLITGGSSGIGLASAEALACEGAQVALLARNHPVGVVFTGLLFGALEAGAQGMQREAGVPAVAVQVTEAVIILVIVLAEVLVRRAGTVRVSEPAAEER